MNGKIDINISMSQPIEEPEKLTPLEKELSTGWMTNPTAEPRYKPTDNRTSLIAKQLKTCRQEFDELGISAEVDFYEYVQHSYGIKLREDYLGNILLTYDVVNEKKFTIFKLKFSS